jgi:RNA polymerase sigma factor (sigma-70 family)
MDIPTQITLLNRLKNQGAAQDWERFYRIYAGPIFGLARQFGLDPNAAQDVVQETMMSLTKALLTFEYDPAKGKFRGWLWRLVRNKTQEAWRRSKKHQATSLDQTDQGSQIAQINQLQSNDVPADEMLEKAWRLQLVNSGMKLLSQTPQISKRNLDIFRAVAIEGRDANEVAVQFDTNLNNIKQIRHRMTDRLTEIVAGLQAGTIQALDTV